MSVGEMDPFETELRATVRGLRAEDVAPARLRATIEAIPDAVRPAGLLERLRRGSPAAAGIAVLAGAAALALLAIGLRPGVLPPVQPGSPGAPGGHFDPAADGAGILSDVFPSLVLVPVLVAGVALVLAARSLAVHRGIRGRGQAARLALAAAVAGGAIFLAATPGFEWSSFYGPVRGLNVTVSPPPGDNDGAPTWYETVNAGEPVVFAVGIQNRALIPIRLDGLVSPNHGWNAITTRGPVDPLPDTIANLPAFSPIIVEPGGWVQLYLATKAGPCVYGPDFVLDENAAMAYATRDRTVVLAYSVLGLQASAPIRLPVNIVEPSRPNCNPLHPGVTGEAGR